MTMTIPRLGTSVTMRDHILDRPIIYTWTLKVARKLPSPILYWSARLVGALVFVFSGRDRSTVRHNLDIIFEGTKPTVTPRRLLWRVFQNYAFYMVDFFRLLSMRSEESHAAAQLYEGRHHLDAALAKGRGVILLTAHIGHWEIGGLGLRAMGYPINVVTIKHNTTFTNALVNTMRTRHGIRVIEIGDSAYDMIELIDTLKRKEILAVLGDRVFNGRSQTASLFGREVWLPVGPMLLAMATGSPVVPAFSIMQSPGSYRGIIEPALELCEGPTREQALKHNLQQVAAVFERFIRRYPDQWYQTEPI